MPISAQYTRRKPEDGILYNAVCQEWPKICAASKADNDGRGLPDFIEDAVDDYLKCGILKHGFVVVKCGQCRQAQAVAFSCKQRGICNSCDGKRMVEFGAQIVDSVIPRVRVRQWVATFPNDIRYMMAWNFEFRGAILRAVMRGLERHYIAQAAKKGVKNAKYAAVSVQQRMDSSARLNTHFHILVADGVWHETDKGVEFVPAPPLKQHVVQQVFEDILKRIDRQIAKLPDPIEEPGQTLRQRDPAFALLLRNAMLGFQTTGKDIGKPQQVEFGKGAPKIKPHGRNCVTGGGFSLHANRTIAPQDREGLEKLARYLCRPAVPASRLEYVENPKDGKTIRIHLKTVWAGGITSVLVTPMDLTIRTLAQIPLPFRKNVNYFGCFASNAKLRAQVVVAGDKPKARRKKSCTIKDESTRLTWAEALKRTWGWDLLKCSCGGTRTVLAAVQKKTEIERFLRHLHLWPDQGQVLSVRGPPELFDLQEIERESDWDDFYDLASKQAADADWAA